MTLIPRSLELGVGQGLYASLKAPNVLDELKTQRYCCVVIPDLINLGGPWKILPPGVHKASLHEIKQIYAYNDHRKHLFEGFLQGYENLKKAKCRDIYLDGSFVTEKPKPGDFDACWSPVGVDSKILDPVLLIFANGRKAQKAKYGGEFFPSTSQASPGITFFNYFQKDKYTDKPKGIICIE